MREGGFDNLDVARQFGLPDAPSLLSVPVAEAAFSVSRLQRPVPPGSPVDVHLAPQAGYFVMLYLQEVAHCDIRADGSRTPVRRYDQGSICLVDLTEGAGICLHSSLDSLAFVIPRRLFRELSEKLDMAAPGDLCCRRGALDPVIANLGSALLCLFDQQGALPALDHIAIAVCAHLVHAYGRFPMREGEAESPLSVWQEATAKEFMLDNFGEDISVAAIAASAGMSTGRFSQSFKRVTGKAPHKWLASLRIAHAKTLLGQQGVDLHAIARACGFSDEDHFTKAFAAETGLTPHAWRRTKMH